MEKENSVLPICKAEEIALAYLTKLSESPSREHRASYGKMKDLLSKFKQRQPLSRSKSLDSEATRILILSIKKSVPWDQISRNLLKEFELRAILDSIYEYYFFHSKPAEQDLEEEFRKALGQGSNEHSNKKCDCFRPRPKYETPVDINDFVDQVLAGDVTVEQTNFLSEAYGGESINSKRKFSSLGSKPFLEPVLTKRLPFRKQYNLGGLCTSKHHI